MTKKAKSKVDTRYISPPGGEWGGHYRTHCLNHMTRAMAGNHGQLFRPF